jgi:hypothetical protein
VGRGIKSEQGRADRLTYTIPELLSDGTRAKKVESNTSVFDPVVCELAYSWWCKPGAVVLDPFAGGSVRGVVASLMGLKYWGCELRAEQVAENQAQLVNPMLYGAYKPFWVCGDSLQVFSGAMGRLPPDADLIFSCPPYGNLEVYSEDPADISNRATFGEFLIPYGQIIANTVARLKQDRFAVWVVGNYRDAQGNMLDFVGETIRCFQAAGAAYYNDIILINSVGSGAMRAENTFGPARKIVKLHQNVLVFVKGNARAATAWVKGENG